MNKKTLKALTVAISLVAGMGAASSAFAVPALEIIGRGALKSCPLSTATKIYNFDKIVFMIGEGNLQPVVAADFVALNALPRLTELDIKVGDDPEKVADIKAKLLFFIGAANTISNRDLIKIIQVAYATAVCPKAP